MRMHPRARHAPILCAFAILAVGNTRTAGAQAARATAPATSLPPKYAGPPTKPAISAADLMTRLYIFADDSMMGRYIGTEGNNKATAYIEREVRRLGLKPAGDSGGYFQFLPTFRHKLDRSSTITAGGAVFRSGVDFVATSTGRPQQIVNVPVVFGGALLDTTNILPNSVVRGKVVLVLPFVPAPGTTGLALQQSTGFQAWRRAMAGARLVTITGDSLNPATVRNTMTSPQVQLPGTSPVPEAPLTIAITTRVAESLLGVPLANATKGMAGETLTSDVRFVDEPALVRNVVAIVPGSDAKLAGEYVALGAHSDHVGLSRPADHDSVRAFNQVLAPEGADSPVSARISDADAARVRALTDSLHAAHGARADSVNNGADDDGSGSVSLLEIAEAFAKGPVKPRRSVLLVWHNGEERGMWGSEYFTDHPTVPLDSIVAQLNMDMVGRGAATDVTGSDSAGKPLHGGPGYLQLIGSRRLSTELGDIVEAVNTEKKLGLQFDYSMDANGHPQEIYCRSDHYEYARYGIPIVFFSTGGHADYHEVTDEPEYIDYARMEVVDRLVFETALRVANLDHRVVVDQAEARPEGPTAGNNQGPKTEEGNAK